MKALLSVDAIQPELLDMLLERLATFDSTEDEDDRSRATMTMSVASQSQRHGYGSKATQPKLFPQILRQLRWLEHVVDGKRLTRKLLDIIAATDGRVQRALITTLPEIVTDGEHGVVVAELKAMLDVNADLMAHVLDALSHLTLEERLLVFY